jgi:hypothetical protein
MAEPILCKVLLPPDAGLLVAGPDVRDAAGLDGPAQTLGVPCGAL